MANIQELKLLLEDILSRVEGISSGIRITPRQIETNQLAEITENLGIVTAGEFRTGNGKEPASGFSGVRMAYPAMLYDCDYYNIAGVDNDVIQWGARSSDGRLMAGGGSVVLDCDGITAIAGTVGGWTILNTTLTGGDIKLDSTGIIYVGPSDSTHIILDGINGVIKTSNFSAGNAGFQLKENGDAEFNNITARGTLRTALFVADEMHMNAGQLGVFKSAGKLKSSLVIPNDTTTAINMDIEDSPSGHATLFDTDDILRIKNGGQDTWFIVDSITDNTTYYTYGVKRASGSYGTILPGLGVADYGASGDGYLLMSADTDNAPYYSVRTHAGDPWATQTETARLGNLNGFLGFTNDEYGLALNQGRIMLGDAKVDSDGIGVFSNELLDYTSRNAIAFYQDSDFTKHAASISGTFLSAGLPGLTSDPTGLLMLTAGSLSTDLNSSDVQDGVISLSTYSGIFTVPWQPTQTNMYLNKNGIFLAGAHGSASADDYTYITIGSIIDGSTQVKIHGIGGPILLSTYDDVTSYGPVEEVRVHASNLSVRAGLALIERSSGYSSDPNAHVMYVSDTDWKIHVSNEGGYGGIIPYEADIINDNLVINGDMTVAQTGTSLTGATGTYLIDKYFLYVVGAAVYTYSQDTDVPTFAESGYNSQYSLKLDCTTADSDIAAGDMTILQHSIEGYDYSQLKEKPVVLSFWVKATETGTYCVSFLNNARDRSYPVEYTINTTNTWEKKIVPVILDQTGGTENYTNGAGLRINWTLAVGSTYQGTKDTWNNGDYRGTSNQVNVSGSTDNNFWLAQVKLEIGSVATPFRTRGVGYAEELELCRRYRRVITDNVIGYGWAATTTISFIGIHLGEMRDTPSLSATAGDWVLEDGVSSYDVTAISLQAGQASKYFVTIRAEVAAGLTAFRPYELHSDVTSGRKLILYSDI